MSSQKSAPPESRPDPSTLKLVVYPAAVLKKRAREVAHWDEWLRAVAERMKDLMQEHKGVGLAAPQVGLGVRLFVWSPEGKREEARAITNPVFSAEHGDEEGEEGCLSLPDIRIKVSRFKSVHLEGLDETGQPIAVDLVDFPARIAQHENDHLEGILLLDRMSPVAKLANRWKIKEMEDQAKGKDKKK